MSIIDNINKQLKFDKDEVYPGGKEIIKQIVERHRYNYLLIIMNF